MTGFCEVLTGRWERTVQLLLAQLEVLFVLPEPSSFVRDSTLEDEKSLEHNAKQGAGNQIRQLKGSRAVWLHYYLTIAAV